MTAEVAFGESEQREDLCTVPFCRPPPAALPSASKLALENAEEVLDFRAHLADGDALGYGSLAPCHLIAAGDGIWL